MKRKAMEEKNRKPITQAFILGAGFGTRLRPLTEATTKVMLPIAPGKPLLEHTIEWFRDHGVHDIIINLHYLPEMITDYFGDGKKFDVRIRYSDESERPMETAGAIKKAGHMLDENFIFTFGDELHFFDPAPLIALHREHNPLATIVLKSSGNPQKGDIAEFDLDTHRITRWHTRPHEILEYGENRLMNAGIYILSKRILDYIPVDTPIKLDGAVLPNAFAAGEHAYAFPSSEPIIDIGTFEDYDWAKEYYKERLDKNGHTGF
jgi:NDP-sugar pyrophosphorylase family protein